MTKKKQKKKKSKRRSEPDATRPLFESDEQHAFIAGYTPAGLSYGITWEEWERLEGVNESGTGEG